MQGTVAAAIDALVVGMLPRRLVKLRMLLQETPVALDPGLMAETIEL